MSHALPRTAVWVLVAALSSSLLVAHADENGSIASSQKESGTPAAKQEESIAARRIRRDRAFEDSIQQRLLKRVTLKFENRELQDVLSQLAKEHDLPLAIDRRTLTDEGVALDQTLSLDAEDITLRSALRLILHPFHLTTILQDETLIVTAGVKAGESLIDRVYDVDRLLPDNDFTELIEVVTSCIEPDAWDEVGGPCSVREFGKTRSLVVRATENVHERVASLLADLDSVIHPDDVKPPVNPIRERQLAIRQKLIEVCSVDCDQAPLERVLSEFTAGNKLPLWTDRATLADEGIAYDQPVTAHLKDVRIESALNHLLRPYDLTWMIDDEMLKVTSRVKADEHLVTHVYEVRDLATKFEPTWPPQKEPGPHDGAVGLGGGYFSVRPAILQQGFGAGAQQSSQGIGGAMPEPRWLTRGYDHTELVETITSTVEPDTWDEVGGPGSVRGFREALVIRQTAAVQARIEILFHNLRTHLRRHAELEAAKPADPGVLKRVVYELVAPYEHSPDELATLIPVSIAPETWKNAGGKATLHVQPTSLVITQTPAIHKKIVKLLYEVVLHEQVE